MPFTKADHKYLSLAIKEAGRDPRDFKVGAVIVTRDRQIVTAHGGEDEDRKEHAEHRAINKCHDRGLSVEGATLYTTLEPCVEQSRSPRETPCAVKILDSPISRVVIGLVDVDARVRERGIRKLRGKRIEVVFCDDAGLRERIENLMAPFLNRDRPHLLECPPFPLAQTFSGRHKERCQLTEWLCRQGEDGHIPVMLIHDGPGGTGKSTLAYTWMKRDVVGDEVPLRADPPGEAKSSRVGVGWRTGLRVLWFSFYSEEGGGDFYSFLERAVQHFSDGTRQPTEYLRGERMDYSSMAEDVRELVRNGPTLVIWDGAERLLREYAHADLFSGQTLKSSSARGLSRLCEDVNVARFLWATAGCVDARLLILSRLPFRDLDNRPAKQIRLHGLAPAEAVDLLRQRGVRGLDRELVNRAKDYEFHPLSLSNLAAAVTDDFAAKGDIREAPRFEAGVPMDGRRRHVLEVAFDKRSPHLRELLSRLSAIDEKASPTLVSLLSADIDLLDPDRLGTDLAELARHGLLNPPQDGSAYTLHPLVREYAYERLKDKHSMHDRLARHYRVDPVVAEGRSVDEVWLKKAKWFFHHTARAGRYMEAYRFFYGSNHPEGSRGRDLNQIVYFELGKYHEYVDLLGQLFPRGTRSLPSVERPLQPFVLNDLALGYRAAGNLKNARALLDRGYRLAAELAKGARTYSYEWASARKAMGQCSESRGEAKFRLGDLKGAERDLFRSIKFYSSLEATAQRLRQAAGERMAVGDLDAAREYGAMSDAWLANYYRAIPYPHRELGELFIYCGAWDRVESFFAPIRNGLKTAGSEEYFYEILWTWAALYGKDIVGAERSIALAEEAFRKLHSSLQYPRWRFEITYLRGEISLARGQLPESERHLTAALNESRLTGDLEQESKALLALARLMLADALRAKGEAGFNRLADRSRELAYQANTLAERCGYALVQADINLCLARLCAEMGDTRTSITHASRANILASCGYRRPNRKSRFYRSVYQESRRLLNGV